MSLAYYAPVIAVLIVGGGLIALLVFVLVASAIRTGIRDTLASWRQP